ncbi:DNA internalization-related competence protein ComEC/Rec2 [Bowmanella dokdonensis]
MASVGHWQIAWQLPADKIRQEVTLSGRIESLTQTGPRQRFNLQLDSLDGQPVGWHSPQIRLSWQSPPWPLKQGQRVILRARLKPPHGTVNQGGFNYQRWLLSSGIRATGYVIGKQDNQLLDDSVSLRQRWLDRLAALELEQGAWLAALTLGYRGWLQPADWLLVQRTGIAHLIAISGLHLGIVSGLGYSLLAWVLARGLGRGRQSLNLHKLALSAALLLALAYAALAGFSLPTARAWLMLSLVIILLWTHRHWRPRRLFLYAMAAFILLFPLSLLSLSFWLSFAAILIIWLVFWRWPVVRTDFSFATAGLSMLRIQLALSLLMLPLVAWQFNLVSFAAPLVNLLAVPVVTLLLVPLCLLALLTLVLVPPLGGWLFGLADSLVALGLSALRWADGLAWAAVNIAAIPLAVWICFALALVVLFLPRLPFSRLHGLWLCLPFLTWTLPGRDPAWHVEVLDVGQGLSVLVHRHGQALVYDTGPAYPSGYNAVEGQLLPLLGSLGIRRLDWLFISHQDNDHAGGQSQLLQALPVQQLMAGERCQAPWTGLWQGLTLTLLWPPAGFAGNENDRSCILHVSDGRHSLLLPGDIGASVEHLLPAGSLKADILLAPHHGSNTSSSGPFIQAVSAAHVVFSQGYLNRWGFPGPEVVARYRRAGARLYQTAEEGQISFRIADGRIEVRTFRGDVAPYWYMRLGK